MKVNLKIKNEKEVLAKMERANVLLKELQDIFQGYSGLGSGIEVELEPVPKGAGSED